MALKPVLSIPSWFLHGYIQGYSLVLCFSLSAACFTSEHFWNVFLSCFLWHHLIFIWRAKVFSQFFFFFSNCPCSTIEWVEYNSPLLNICYIGGDLDHVSCFDQGNVCLETNGSLECICSSACSLGSWDPPGEKHTPNSSWLMTMRKHMEQTWI